MIPEDPQRQTAEEPLLVDIEVSEPHAEEALPADPSQQAIALQEPSAPEPQPQERPCRRRLGQEEDPPTNPAAPTPSARPRLGENRPVPAPPAGSPQAQARADEAHGQTLIAAIRAKQNLTMGVLAGAAAAVGGAVIWAVVTVVTSFQIGWMAVGVGFLVGSAVRAAGKGVDKPFGYAGAALAVGGCLLGNLLSICAVIAQQESIGITTVLTQLNPAAIPELMAVTFHPMDLLFYAIAVYEGYRFSFRNVTEADVARLTANQMPQAG